MERLLHYTWKHRLFPLGELVTTDGQSVEVLDVGQHNSNQGPDFFNAKIRIGSLLWVGNVEIHDKASDWFVHGHDRDSAYNNVILHVVDKADRVVKTKNGIYIPQLELHAPQKVTDAGLDLFEEERYPSCHNIIDTLPKQFIENWLADLLEERLEQKQFVIREYLQSSQGSWEYAFFVTLARSYGFGVNGDAFEAWAKSLPLGKIAHHRDNLFQIQAIFLGQAALLSRIQDNEKRALLEAEYAYLRHKFDLEPIAPQRWKYLRMRSQNFPHNRILQLAQIYYEHRMEISRIIECKTLKDVRRLLSVEAAPLSSFALNILVINTIVPLFLEYGKAMGDTDLQQRAYEFLNIIPAENNAITRAWSMAGLKVASAGQSQALIQLQRQYCELKKCIYCDIGHIFRQLHTAEIQ